MPLNVIVRSLIGITVLLAAAPALIAEPAEPVEPIHLHLISGSKEYQSEPSLKAWREHLAQRYANVRVTASWGKDGGRALPNLEPLADADVMVVFLRRNKLPDDQLAQVRSFWRNGGAVIGIRTAGHAFDRETNKEFDHKVLGGSYSGHGGGEPVQVSIVEKNAKHPVLKGVETWQRDGKLYHNPNNAEGTVTLLTGKGEKSGDEQPLAWVYERDKEVGGGRSFYTSMGYPHDFKNDKFRRLLANAVQWTTERELEPRASDQTRGPSVGGGRLSAEQLDELYEGVPLPKGDPDPDPEYDTGADVELPQRPGHLGREMDYGPYLAMSVDMGGESGVIERGLTVRLADDVSAVYDTETMNVAGYWRGQFIDLSNTHYESMKGRNMARPGGKPVFSQVDIAGWADRDGRFDTGERGTNGNLAWIDFRGHHLYEDRVILEYEVHGRKVYEMPGIGAGPVPGYRPEGGPLLIRNFEVASADEAVQVLVADDASVHAALFGPSEQVKLRRTDGQTTLTVAPASQPIRFAIVLGTNEQTINLLGDGKGRINLSAAIRHGGKSRWTQTIDRPIKRGEPINGFAHDQIELPNENPYGSWMQPSAIDFFSDGRLAMSTLNGDVWVARGLNDGDDRVTWRRFATGFYQPLGLKIHDDQVYVTGRDRITKLVDVNDDGEADSYISFHDGGYVAPGYHAFAFGLERDSDGYWYFLRSGRKADAPGQNAMFRVSPDGATAERYATGFRHPNGMGLSPDGMLVCSDNQGDWIPSSKISVIEKAKFYGYVRNKQADGPNDFTPPMLWLSTDVDSSSGGQAWADAKRFGPLSGKMIHTSYSHASAFYVMIENVDGQMQAAAVQFPWTFRSGAMRAAVNPVDGQLFIAGLKGWDTKAKEDGSLSRIRYTGDGFAGVTAFETTAAGIKLTFNRPLDDAAADPAAYTVEAWNYIYSSRYGSPHMKVSDPDEEGHDAWPVSEATLSNNGRTVHLTLPDIQPANQVRIKYQLTTRDGGRIGQTIHATINQMPRR